MSELTKFRDYARAMSGTEHSQACQDAQRQAKDRWTHRWLFREWLEAWGPEPTEPPKPCPGGCVSEADRELWLRLASEIDEYLEPQPDLFGEMTAEPQHEATDTEENESA